MLHSSRPAPAPRSWPFLVVFLGLCGGNAACDSGGSKRESSEGASQASEEEDGEEGQEEGTESSQDASTEGEAGTPTEQGDDSNDDGDSAVDEASAADEGAEDTQSDAENDAGASTDSGETGESGATGETTDDGDSNSGEEADADGTSGSETDTDLPPECDRLAARVEMQTNHGVMVFQLDGVKMPRTVDNFLGYVEEGYYDGTIFDRVIDNFVVQGDGKRLDGTDNPPRDPIAFETHPQMRHVDGALSMGLKSPGDDSGATEIFICDGAQHFLDGDYAAFGVLIEGWEALRAIAAVRTDGDDLPLDPVVIERMGCLE